MLALQGENMNENTDSQAIDRPFASASAEAPPDDLLAAYVGPNSDYYLERFATFAAGGNPLSWNWPAFFITSVWLLYRKMWAWFFVYVLGLPVVLAVFLLVASPVSSEWAGPAMYLLYALFVYVLAPLFGNRLYYAHVKARVAKVASGAATREQQAAELARTGGTSKAFAALPLLVLLAGILSAVGFSPFQDYAIRSQVADGISLAGGAKAAVTATYETQGVLPANNAEAGLPEPLDIYDDHVSSVAVHPGAIEVTFGNDAHELIDGQTLVLEAETGGGVINWVCYSESIETRHLPEACQR